MEEKKLTDEVVVAKNAITDEEIAKAILQQIEYNAGIPYIDEWLKVKTIKFTDILNFIHRLQAENKELKSPKFASWKLKFFNLKEEFDKELAEHEAFAKKAKAEIERLTEERKTANKHDLMYWFNAYKECVADYEEYGIKNAELQKKVDEWTDVFGSADNFARVISNLRMKNGNRIATSQELLEWVTEKTEQAVKDTAKEILQELIEKAYSSGCIDLNVNEVKAWFREYYGVEV